MDKKTVNLEIINGLKSKGINIAEVEKNHLGAFADIMYKAINYSQCCESDSELLKNFNCINVVDGLEQCKTQCAWCEEVNGF